MGSYNELIGKADTFAYCQDEFGEAYTTVAEGCVLDKIKHEDSCKAHNGQWITPQLTRDSCEGFAGTGCNPIITNWLSNQDEKQCGLCDNEAENFYSWKQGKWVHAKSYELSWIKREMKQQFQWKKTLNFTTFNDLVQRSLAARTTAYGKTTAFCRYSVITSAIQAIACDCTDSGKETESCYSKQTAIPVGEDTPCAGTSSTLRLTSGQLEYSANSVDIEDQCLKVSVAVVSKDQFQRGISQPAPLSSVFVMSPREEGGQYGPFEVVKNENDAVVGEVIGSGLHITASGVLSNVTICVNLAEAADSSYKVYDIGVSNPQYDVVVVQTEGEAVVASSNRICVLFERIDRSLVVVPIARNENYESDQTDDGYSVGVKAYYYVVACLFMCNVLFATFLLVLTKFTKITMNLYLLGFILLVLLFNLVRSITYFLLPEEIILDAPVAIFYLMVELPALLFLSAFMLVIYLWLVASKARRLGVWRWAMLFINLFIYAVFAMLIVLYHLLPDEPPPPVPDEVRVCGRGTIPPPSTELSTGKHAVLITYRVFVASIALAVACFVAGYALKINSVIFAGKSDTKILMYKLMTTAVVCAASFILQAVFLVVTLAVNLDPYVTTSLIIVIEIVPSLAMLLMIVPSKKQARKLNRTQHVITGASGSPGRSLTNLNTWSSSRGDTLTGTSSNSSY